MQNVWNKLYRRIKIKGCSYEQPFAFEVDELFCVVLLDSQLEELHGALKVLAVENVGKANFVNAAAGSGIEACAGSVHNGFVVVAELGEQPGLELIGIVNGQLSHHVERTLGFLANYAGDLHQLAVDGVATTLILFANGCKVIAVYGVEGSGGYLVEGGNGQPGLAVLEDVGLEFLVAGDQGTDTGAAGAEALGYGVDDDGVLVDVIKLSDGIQSGVLGIYELAVYFVTDDEEAMLLGDVGHQAHFFLGENNAGGVAGVGEHDSPGLVGDEGFDAGAVGVFITFFGGGGQGNDLAAGGVYEGTVVGVEGFGDDDFIAVIQNAAQNHGQSLGTAGGDDDVVGGKLYADVCIVLLNGLDHNGKSGRGSVLQNRKLEILNCVKICRGGLDVGLADVKVIDLDALLVAFYLVGIELTNGGKTALFNLAGKLHLKTFLLIILFFELMVNYGRKYTLLDNKNYTILYLINKGKTEIISNIYRIHLIVK